MATLAPSAATAVPSPPPAASRERAFAASSGYLMLVAALSLALLVVALFVVAGVAEEPALLLLVLPTLIADLLLWRGFFLVEPNQARVLVLFGRYHGTVRESGFYWTNPFTSRRKLSVRAQNLNGKPLKVNDLLGNPIEIAAVVVWRVRDTAQASFDVQDHVHFVEVQSESAVRLVASRHPYDEGQAGDVRTTLRGSADEVAHELAHELAQRLAIAGIEVVEARLSHLAYAPEIAAAMLQRQQATAIIAARQMMVDGAVGMVEMALARLGEKHVLELDQERRATLVGNLLVVLCGHVAPSPVVNTGTLYN
jgi:regulator of protease activity HflC (stomatin/prohibitin superfamily)